MKLDIPGQNHLKSTLFWVFCYHGGNTYSISNITIFFPIGQGYKPPFFHHVVGNSCANIIYDMAYIYCIDNFAPIYGGWIDFIFHIYWVDTVYEPWNSLTQRRSQVRVLFRPHDIYGSKITDIYLRLVLFVNPRLMV